METKGNADLSQKCPCKVIWPQVDEVCLLTEYLCTGGIVLVSYFIDDRIIK